MTDQVIDAQSFKGDVTNLSVKLRIFVATIRVLEQIVPSIAAKLMLEKFITPRRKATTNYVGQLPAGARQIGVFHNLTKITGWAWGDDGPAILLIHGWEGHTGRMIPLIEPLLQQGYRVFTLDAPGHGLSPATKTHLLDVGYAIQSMMEQHGPFYGVIAHSFGAAATVIMLANEPDLMPEKLVLLSPMRDIQQHFDIFASVARLSPTLKKRVYGLAVNHVGQSFESVSTIDAIRMLKKPGLVIHDCHDQLIPYEVGETISRNWHGSRFIATEKLGHRMGLTSASIRQHILTYLAHTSQILPDILAQAIYATTPNEAEKSHEYYKLQH